MRPPRISACPHQRPASSASHASCKKNGPLRPNTDLYEIDVFPFVLHILYLVPRGIPLEKPEKVVLHGDNYAHDGAEYPAGTEQSAYQSSIQS